jgi:hypothetical protein
LKPKLNYATGRKPHEGFSEDEVNSRYPNIPQDPADYKRKKYIWRSKKIFNGLRQPKDTRE